MGESHEMPGTRVSANNIDRLSNGQRDCLRFVHQGFEGKEIARLLGISPNAVIERLRVARRVLGVGSSREAARALALYEQGNAYNPYVDKPFGVATDPGMPMLAPSITSGSAGPSDAALLREEQAEYLVEPPRSRSALVWPVPRKGAPSNDLTINQTMITILALALGFGLLALVAITLVDQLSRLRLG